MPKSITFSESAINIPCFVEMLKQWDSYNWQVALNVSYLREREDGFPEFRLCPHCTFSMIRWWKWQKGGFESATWMKATPALYDSMNVEGSPIRSHKPRDILKLICTHKIQYWLRYRTGWLQTASGMGWSCSIEWLGLSFQLRSKQNDTLGF